MSERPTAPRTAIPMAFPSGVSAEFDVDAFDDAILAHGVDLVHFAAMRNPVGMIDEHDSRRPGDSDVAASNGMIYAKVGCFTGLLVGNSKDLKDATGGVLDGSTAQLTAPRFYDCSPPQQPERIYLMPMDRLYLRQESILVPCHHFVTAHPSLTDRLRFPAIKVQQLVDADGNRYSSGSDFTVSDGNVVWVPGRAPLPDPVTGRGKIYSIRYLYRPFWYIERLTHEIRVAQHEDPLGNRTVEQMPQAAFVQREYVFRNEDQNPAAPDTERQAPAAPDGQFGRR